MLEKMLRRVNLAKLSRREKYIVLGLVGALAVFIAVQLIVRPLFTRNARLRQELQVKTAALTEMHQMKAEYQKLQSGANQAAARFGRREDGFTLFTFLDGLAGETGIKAKISYMKPSTVEQKDSPYKISRVEMKLDDITLQQLTDYLYRVETSANMVTIRKMSVTKKEQQESLLSAVLQVETLES